MNFRLEAFQQMSDAAKEFQKIDGTKLSDQILTGGFYESNNAILLQLRPINSLSQAERTDQHQRVRHELCQAIKTNVQDYSLPEEVIDKYVKPTLDKIEYTLRNPYNLLSVEMYDKAINDYDKAIRKAQESCGKRVTGANILHKPGQVKQENKSVSHVQGGKNMSHKISSGNSKPEIRIFSGNSNHMSFLKTLNKNAENANKASKSSNKPMKPVSSKIKGKIAKLNANVSTGNSRKKSLFG